MQRKIGEVEDLGAASRGTKVNSIDYYVKIGKHLRYLLLREYSRPRILLPISLLPRETPLAETRNARLRDGIAGQC